MDKANVHDYGSSGTEDPSYLLAGERPDVDPLNTMERAAPRARRKG
ncbi:MAG: hypothetical protein WBE62_00010 [Methylocella sp.]